MGMDNSLNIIIAEDDPLNQKIAIRMLEKLGYRADVASNGLEVLQAFEHKIYDFVLMDIQMPRMDGIEAIKVIRKYWSPGPKIIVATSLALDTCQNLCFDAGADDVLEKPLKREELKAAMERNIIHTLDVLPRLEHLTPELSA